MRKKQVGDKAKRDDEVGINKMIAEEKRGRKMEMRGDEKRKKEERKKYNKGRRKWSTEGRWRKKKIYEKGLRQINLENGKKEQT